MSDIIEITDFVAPELDIYARLTEGQLLNHHEPDKGVFIAGGPKVVEHALDTGCIPIPMLMEKRHVESQAREIIQRHGKIPVYATEFGVLTQLTGFRLAWGMPCAVYRPPLPGPEEVCEGAHRITVLENVVNPTNVGTMFRSAAALDIDGVLLTSTCSDPLYRRAVRVSIRTVFQIPWIFLDSRLPWPQEGVRFLRELGFTIAAMALNDDSVSIDDSGLMLEEKLAIILGTEGDGLTTGTIVGCDYMVRILMSHGTGSLNIVTASAVAFRQLRRR